MSLGMQGQPLQSVLPRFYAFPVEELDTTLSTPWRLSTPPRRERPRPSRAFCAASHSSSLIATSALVPVVWAGWSIELDREGVAGGGPLWIAPELETGLIETEDHQPYVVVHKHVALHDVEHVRSVYED